MSSESQNLQVTGPLRHKVHVVLSTTTALHVHWVHNPENLVIPAKATSQFGYRVSIYVHIYYQSQLPSCSLVKITTYPAVYMPHDTSKGERGHTAIGLREATV